MSNIANENYKGRMSAPPKQDVQPEKFLVTCYIAQRINVLVWAARAWLCRRFTFLGHSANDILYREKQLENTTVEKDNTEAIMERTGKVE